MVVISRKESEKFYINRKEIRIVVLQSTHGKVKLGIEAAANVPILREELYERIKTGQNQQEQQVGKKTHWEIN